MAVHIGIAKTGTTSIQRYLVRNRELLLDRFGLLIPRTSSVGVGHHAIAVDLNEPPRSPELRIPDLARRLRAEFEASGAERALLSSEWLGFSHHPERLPEVLGTDDIDIVVRLRRQDQWLESMFREQLKRTGSVTDIDEYAAKPRIQRVADFDSLLGRWSAVAPVERTRVGLFPPGEPGRSIEVDLLADVGVVAEDLPVPDRPTKLALNRHSLAYLEEQRARGATITPSSGDFVLRALARFSRREPDPPQWRHHLDPQRRRRYLDGFLEGNANVARHYLGRDALFSDAPSDGPWEPYPGLDDETRAQIEVDIEKLTERRS